jgi:hypothetical protein
MAHRLAFALALAVVPALLTAAGCTMDTADSTA